MAAKKEVETVPEIVEETVPEIVEETVPEIVEGTVPVPEIIEGTVPVTEGKVEEPLVLRAVSHILYQSRQYTPGQELPTNNLDMVKAWIDAGTAAWMGTASDPVKARPATAVGGLAGEAVGPETGSEGDLVGRVPDTEQRKEA